MTQVQKPFLALDFDGVLANSIHDSFCTALNTYVLIQPDHALPLQAPLQSGRDMVAFEEAHPELFIHFQNLIPLGNRAEDYYVMLNAIDKGHAESIRTQADHDALKDTLPENRMRRYHEAFYALRRRCQTADPAAWSDLLPAFPEAIDAVKRLSKRFTLAIATSKDRISIDMQLAHYGLSDYFESRNILDKDFSDSKRRHLEQFHQNHHIAFDRIYFVDDKLLHLDAVAPLGVHPCLALWGFNTQREHDLAVQRGYAVLTLNTFASMGP